MKWKFCEFCYINGHCENQDRGHKCECYGKKLEDKCERLEKQLDVAENAIEYARQRCENCINGVCQYCHLSFVVTYYKDKEKALKNLKELEK